MASVSSKRTSNRSSRTPPKHIDCDPVSRNASRVQPAPNGLITLRTLLIHSHARLADFKIATLRLDQQDRRSRFNHEVSNLALIRERTHKVEYPRVLLPVMDDRDEAST